MQSRVLSRAREGHVEPVIFVLGDAGVLVQRVVDGLIEAVLPRCGLPAFNHSTVRLGDGDGGDTALSTARTLPMMADNRLVVVKDLEQGGERFFTELLDYLAEPSPTTTLLLTGTGFPKVRKGGKNWKTRVKNALKKHGGVLEEYDAGSVRPAEFAADHATSLGKRLSRDAADLLVELVGRDPDVLVQEIEKVALYVGDQPQIDGGAIHAACSSLAEAVVWDLTAGLAARDADLALGSLHRLLAGSGSSGDDQPHKLLGLITWQMRQILVVAQMIRQRRPESEIRRAVRMRPDHYAKVRDAVSQGMHGAAEVFEQLLAANRAMNRSRAGDKRIIEALVTELCT